MVNSNSVFNIKYAEFSTKWQVFLRFHNPTCAYNQRYNLHEKSVLLLPSIFTSLFHPYLFTKSSLQSLLTLPFSIPQQFFTSLFLRRTMSTIYTKNIFPTSTNPREQGNGSLLSPDTVLISPFFHKVWIVITGKL